MNAKTILNNSWGAARAWRIVYNFDVEFGVSQEIYNFFERLEKDYESIETLENWLNKKKQNLFEYKRHKTRRSRDVGSYRRKELKRLIKIDEIALNSRKKTFMAKYAEDLNSFCQRFIKHAEKLL